MAGWGQDKALCDENRDDRIELIDDTAEVRLKFGENFGAFEFILTRKEIEELLSGKVVAFDINQREYAGFLSVKNKDTVQNTLDKG
jgi:hypothetical protein